ncbi:hypothetical protein ACHHYP_06797 [Achlya hypogyna]|uniref:Uncharacterized protein n=1 Tax=Achlya hypogyna TaxID=1202772 RepID=A0A1V9YRR1_ACHHY|nr:hypothetical protein ACHHYP_06797 [Achlya hypogyna]
MNTLRHSSKRIVLQAQRRFTTEAAAAPKPTGNYYEHKWRAHSKWYIFATFVGGYAVGSALSGGSCSKRHVRHHMDELRAENRHLALRIDNLQRALDDRRYTRAVAPATVAPYSGQA